MDTGEPEVVEAVNEMVSMVSMTCAVSACLSLIHELELFQRECWEIEAVREAKRARALLKKRRDTAERLRRQKSETHERIQLREQKRAAATADRIDGLLRKAEATQPKAGRRAAAQQKQQAASTAASAMAAAPPFTTIAAAVDPSLEAPRAAQQSPQSVERSDLEGTGQRSDTPPFAGWTATDVGGCAELCITPDLQPDWGQTLPRDDVTPRDAPGSAPVPLGDGGSHLRLVGSTMCTDRSQISDAARRDSQSPPFPVAKTPSRETGSSSAPSSQQAQTQGQGQRQWQEQAPAYGTMREETTTTNDLAAAAATPLRRQQVDHPQAMAGAAAKSSGGRRRASSGAGAAKVAVAAAASLGSRGNGTAAVSHGHGIPSACRAGRAGRAGRRRAGDTSAATISATGRGRGRGRVASGEQRQRHRQKSPSGTKSCNKKSGSTSRKKVAAARASTHLARKEGPGAAAVATAVAGGQGQMAVPTYRLIYSSEVKELAMAQKLADKRSSGVTVKQQAPQVKARQCASGSAEKGGGGGGGGSGSGSGGGRSLKSLQAQSERVAELHALQYASIRYERKQEKRKEAAKEKAAASGSYKKEANSASAIHVLKQLQAGSVDIYSRGKSKEKAKSERSALDAEPEPEPESESEM